MPTKSNFPELAKEVCSSDRLADRYTVAEDEMLGSGAFSQVFLVTSKDGSGERKAVKRIQKKLMSTKDPKTGKRFIDLKPIEEEVKLQRLCCANSNNIVQIFDVFDSGALVDIVLEPMMKDDLFDAIEKVYYADTANNKYSELEASKIIRQIISAVGACHAHSVCHRDLKPENILVYKYGERGDGVDHHAMVVKLCDFGLATQLAPGQKLTDACGTPEYVAPEVVSKMVDEAPSYDFAADIWSVGVILYILLSGEQPFHSESEDAGRNTAEVLQQVRKHKSLQDKFDSEPEVWSAVSAPAKALLDAQMLARDGSKRPSAKDLLLNPWITGADADTTHNSAALAKQHRRWLRRKFRAAIYAMVATNRIRSFVHNLRAAKVTATEEGCTAEAYNALLDDFRAGAPVAGTSVEECLVEQAAFVALLKKHGRAAGSEAEHFEMFATRLTGGEATTLNYRDYCVGLGWRTASPDSMKFDLIFHAFDANGDGVLEHDEFVIMMQALSKRTGAGSSAAGGYDGSMAATSALFSKIDGDGDGLIDQAEFRIWAEEKSSIVQSYLKVVSVLPAEGTALPGQGTGFGATDGAAGGGAKTAQVVAIKQGSSCCVVS